MDRGGKVMEKEGIIELVKGALGGDDKSFLDLWKEVRIVVKPWTFRDPSGMNTQEDFEVISQEKLWMVISHTNGFESSTDPMAFLCSSCKNAILYELAKARTERRKTNLLVNRTGDFCFG